MVMTDKREEIPWTRKIEPTSTIDTDYDYIYYEVPEAEVHEFLILRKQVEIMREALREIQLEIHDTCIAAHIAEKALEESEACE